MPTRARSVPNSIVPVFCRPASSSEDSSDHPVYLWIAPLQMAAQP
jgi:hypothetical protein